MISIQFVKLPTESFLWLDVMCWVLYLPSQSILKAILWGIAVPHFRLRNKVSVWLRNQSKATQQVSSKIQIAVLILFWSPALSRPHFPRSSWVRSSQPASLTDMKSFKQTVDPKCCSWLSACITGQLMSYMRASCLKAALSSMSLMVIWCWPSCMKTA